MVWKQWSFPWWPLQINLLLRRLWKAVYINWNRQIFCYERQFLGLIESEELTGFVDGIFQRHRQKIQIPKDDGTVEEKKVFWLLNGLGLDDEAFVTIMLCPPFLPIPWSCCIASKTLYWKSMHSDVSNRHSAFVVQRWYNQKNKFDGQQNKNFNSQRRFLVQATQNAASQNNDTKVKATSVGTRIKVLHIRSARSLIAVSLKCWHRFNQAFQAEEIQKAF